MKTTGRFPVGWALTAGEERLLTLPLSTVLRNMLITGTTGWGKSGAVLSLILTALTKFRPIGVVLVDGKGETAHELVENFLPALAESHPHLDPSQVAIVKPFGRRYGIQLNPLYPIPGLDAAVQAHIVASLIAELAEGNIGPRMKSLLSSLCHVGIVARATLLDLLGALREPTQAEILASRVPDEELRHYLTEVLPREPAASKDALRARLEWLLLIPEIRAMLCSPTAVSGSALLEAPLTVVDLGGDIPLGFLSLAQVIGSWITTVLTAAVFCRTTPAHPVIFVIDEWQVVVGKSAAELERMLSQARFRAVNLVLANQTLGQITDTSLLRSLLTNISLHWAFRPGEKDVEHVLPLLPVTGRAIDPERPDQFLSKEAERRVLLERLAKLPPRHALLTDLVGGRAEIVRTLSVPYAEAKRRSAGVGSDLRERCRRGRFGVPFNELQQAAERQEQTALPATAAREPSSGRPPAKPTRAAARPRLVLP
jgi:hypothetical protein